ncbi:MAG: hypothetical protein RR404_01180 [Bacilli bacterium]
MIDFIFFGSDDIVIDKMYRDINNHNRAIYKKGMYNSDIRFLKFLFKVSFNHISGKWLPYNIKKIWFKYIMGYDNISENAVFVFTRDNIRYLELGFRKYLKTHYKKCKIIALFLDIDGLRKFDERKINKFIDDSYVFDNEEAKDKHIKFYPLCYSKVEVENNKKEIDICFIGQDKGRLEDLYKVYKQAKKLNLRTAFYICGEYCEKYRNYPGIKFVENMEYEEVLKIISKSKYNLEMCLSNTSAITIRLYESISFSLGLITNNEKVRKSPYYDAEFIKICNFDNIDLSFANEEVTYDFNSLKQKINPVAFVDYLLNLYL